MAGTLSTEPARPASSWLSVEEARARILAAVQVLGLETVAVERSHGRVTADDIRARTSHPPVPVSAMDGYAVRAEDVAHLPARLRTIGVSRAGARFSGAVTPGTCVRIFTGAMVPDGADVIALQEDATATGDEVEISAAPPKHQYIRPAGLDFAAGQICVRAGRTLTARDVGLLASSGHGQLDVRRQPRVAILSTGDELVAPGTIPGPDQIVGSNGVALAAAVASWGAVAIDIGIAADDVQAIAAAAERALDADILVTTGGASAGDHDLVHAGIVQTGFVPDFWKIAMTPGKPLMFGRIGSMPVIGMPGNPVSALVCSILFLRPVLRKMLGMASTDPAFESATLGAAMGANDRREAYARATLERAADGRLVARPYPTQDSSMQMALANAEALIRRRPLAPAAEPGEQVEIIRLDLVESSF